MLGNVHPFVCNHFRADKRQHEREPHGKKSQTPQDSGEKKVHGAQSQNRENVGRVDDEGILRDAKNRGDGINCQGDVRHFDD